MAGAEAIAGLGAISQIAGGIGANRQAKSNAKLLRRIGQIEADEERKDTRRLLGAQRAVAAGRGIDLNVGSILDIFAETSVEGEVAALRLMFARESAAVAQENEGKQALLSGILGATGTILGPLQEKFGATKSREGETDLPRVERIPGKRGAPDRLVPLGTG